MRRRLLVIVLALDGLCALALPLVAPVLGIDGDRYVEVAGACVERLETGDDALGGRVVSDLFCALG